MTEKQDTLFTLIDIENEAVLSVAYNKEDIITWGTRIIGAQGDKTFKEDLEKELRNVTNSVVSKLESSNTSVTGTVSFNGLERLAVNANHLSATDNRHLDAMMLMIDLETLSIACYYSADTDKNVADFNENGIANMLFKWDDVWGSSTDVANIRDYKTAINTLRTNAQKSVYRDNHLFNEISFMLGNRRTMISIAKVLNPEKETVTINKR